MQQAIYLALSLLLLLAVPASALLWLRLIIRHRASGAKGFFASLVPVRRRDRPFWSPVDVLVMLGTMIVIGQLLMMGMISRGWIESPVLTSDAIPTDVEVIDQDPALIDQDPALIDQNLADGDSNSDNGSVTRPPTQTNLLASIAANSIAGLSGMVVVIAWMRLFSRQPCRQLGLTCSHDDLWLGLVGSLMILPVVLMVSAAATLLREYEHPVLTSLAQISTPTIFAATFIGTAMVTPLVEEFMVRGLLQGGLQGLADPQPRIVGDDGLWEPKAWWPLVVASLLFALLHLGQGAAPIPLFVLSLGLGYLYRQTGSLAAPIIVHMVLNGLTITIEVLKP